MNIYALKGFQVVCLKKGCNLTELEKKNVRKYLRPGEVYTIDKTIVYKWYTHVIIKEAPSVKFCASNFVDLKPQSKEDDMKHLDWAKYHNY